MQFTQFLNQKLISTCRHQQKQIVSQKNNISQMQKDDDFALINVVRHLKYCVQNTQSNYHLALEYKYAKPTQPTVGNEKYHQILTKSHEHTMIMNGTREMKKKPYLHLKSLTQYRQFRWLHMNIKLLNKKHPIKIEKSHKIDLTVNDEKVSFESETMRWNYKTNRLLFRPNYEAAKNGKLFRISLVSSFKGTTQLKRRVVDMLEEALGNVIDEKNKQVEGVGKGGSCPLRFKEEVSFGLNKCCSLVTSRVFEVANTKLNEEILQLINNQNHSHDNDIGRILLSEIASQVFEQFQKDLTYESEFRFSSNFIKQFEEMHEQQIEQLMQKGGLIFTSMFRDPHDFTYEDVVDDLKSLESYW